MKYQVIVNVDTTDNINSKEVADMLDDVIRYGIDAIHDHDDHDRIKGFVESSIDVDFEAVTVDESP